MSYIVLDMEWNRPGASADIIRSPFLFLNEIVEFGAVRLSDSFEPLDECRILVRPTFYPEMNGWISRLTGIYDRTLRDAKPFPEAYREFTEWCGDHNGFLTWGPDDATVLMDNLLIHGLSLDDFPASYDLQRMFGREVMWEEYRQYSLESAMNTMRLPQDRAHDALNDARSAARLACACLDLDVYMEEYRTVYVHYDVDRIHTKELSCRHNVSADPEIASFICPCCGETVTCSDWIYHSTFYAAASCTCGDEFYVNVLRRKGEDHYTARRVIREMSVDLLDIFERKLDRQPA